ncbi:GNAT family N-acetyltransferase [Ktedonospora formicarum]|uniref:N-acetyltransferase domain-containing protein n=1 Tax=Ktedonospora formicarum TaxID=2778364 RepID=A0A8J3HS78_9CHLR|nr:GNAT family N-acetyltransferase [Ktedonospora formicarum]GHO42977.1 hypothetical protein KSX_11400 [Ktedonospora formicarum]
MIVRLHNLAARRPVLADLAGIQRLFHIECDCKDTDGYQRVEDDVQTRWRTQGLRLERDAWVIVCKSQEIVAYTDVMLYESASYLTLTLIVHPAYRGRGIGTLLIRLAEQRARDIVDELAIERPFALQYVAHNQDLAAKNLLEREGYELRDAAYVKMLYSATSDALLYAEAAC